VFELTTPYLLTAGVIVIAAIFQRITGLGFGLVGVPLVVLLLGPVEGVLVMMVNSVVISGIMAAGSLRDIVWRRAWRLVLAGIIVSPLAVWLVYILDAAWLMIVVACAAFLSLSTSYITAPLTWLSGRRGLYIAGSMSGFLHITSGLSGPPLVAYSQREAWPQKSFVATIQVVFLSFNLLTLALRGLPSADLHPLIITVAATILGTFLGAMLQKRIPTLWATRAMIAIAWLGTLAVLVRGVVALVFSG